MIRVQSKPRSPQAKTLVTKGRRAKQSAVSIKPELKDCFLVWGRVKGLPNISHPTIEKARLEAWRLAMQNPGRSFLVMQAVDVRRLELPNTISPSPAGQGTAQPKKLGEGQVNTPAPSLITQGKKKISPLLKEGSKPRSC